MFLHVAGGSTRKTTLAARMIALGNLIEVTDELSTAC
jgi:hypothetical protein